MKSLYKYNDVVKFKYYSIITKETTVKIGKIVNIDYPSTLDKYKIKYKRDNGLGDCICVREDEIIGKYNGKIDLK